MYLIILFAALVIAAVVAIVYFQSRNKAEMPQGHNAQDGVTEWRHDSRPDRP